MKIPLIKPYITQEVKDKVCEVLDSGYLTEGPVTKEFEEALKEYIGCQYAIAVCNCTVGLELALRVLNIGPGDEVIVPDYTYPKNPNCKIIGEMPGSKYAFDHCLTLPMYHEMTKEDQDRVVEELILCVA